MRAIQAQYFLAFALLGCLQPYLPVYLASQGLTDAQVGWVLSFAGWSVLFAPVLVTLFADTHLENKTLIVWSFALGAATLAWLLAADTFWLILIAHAAYASVYAPMIPLHDGLNFAVQQQRAARGLPMIDYHRVRVWGTVGFIVPSLVLYLWVRKTGNINTTLLVAIAACVLGLLNATLLPRVRQPLPAVNQPPQGGPGLSAARSRLPTYDALCLLARPRLAVFCIALWLMWVAMTAFHSFYPLYLTRDLSIGTEWIGLISTVGVVVEFFFVLGFGRLRRAIGLRGIFVLGAAATAVRMGLLWLVPDPVVAIATQTLHGPSVLLMLIAAPIYLDRHADERCRNSVQGLFAMLVAGTGRIVGSIVAGYLAAESIALVFALAAALSVVVAGVFLAVRVE